LGASYCLKGHEPRAGIEKFPFMPSLATTIVTPLYQLYFSTSYRLFASLGKQSANPDLQVLGALTGVYQESRLIGAWGCFQQKKPLSG
jgi:hypothetical protein